MQRTPSDRFSVLTWEGDKRGWKQIPLSLRVFLFASLVILFLVVLTFANPNWSARHASLGGHAARHSDLANLALGKVVKDGAPIFGLTELSPIQEPWTADWMKKYHDETLIVNMNLPGTHDAATWNYSQITQASLEYVNSLGNITAVDPANYKCQSRSILQMLNAGIRVFDLRYAFDVTRMALVFWHGNALQSETATVDDVLYSFYAWLDAHPSEALFLSFQHEGGGNDAATQLMLFNTLTSPAAKQYILQARGDLGTLRNARGKIILLRRFDLDHLPPSFEDIVPGIHFSPQKWTVNGANITLIYNESTHSAAHIQDYYAPQTPHGSTAELNIQWKLNATTAHLQRAADSGLSDSLFWSFASSTNTANDPPDTPEIQALGNGTLTPKGGVNQQLLPFFKRYEGKRLGIVMFDFYDQPADLIPVYLGLLAPDQALRLTKCATRKASRYCT